MMDRLATCATLLSLIACAAVRGLYAQEEDRAPEIGVRLLSHDANVRERARRELMQQRRRLIVRLIAAIEDEGRRSSNLPYVSDAMAALGDIRAVEGADVLVRHIGYPQIVETDDEEAFHASTLTAAPAVYALVAIGEPCVPAVIAKIRSSAILGERERCVDVLRRLRLPHLRGRLERAAAETVDSREAERLRDALERYDRWLPPEERSTQTAVKVEEALKRLGYPPAVSPRILLIPAPDDTQSPMNNKRLNP